MMSVNFKSGLLNLYLAIFIRFIKFVSFPLTEIKDPIINNRIPKRNQYNLMIK